MNKPLILIVEDDPPIRNLISVTLEAHEYRYIVAGNAGNAIMEATSHNPDIMLLDEPTRGIDVGAKYEIYCIINELAAAGKCVVMISSELPEVLGLSDRIYIMNEGKMVGEMKAEEATQESIMAMILQSGRGA